jgi:YbbR domain-containing protein
MAGFQLTKTQRRKLSIFLQFVFFACIAWVILAFSNNYAYQRQFAIQYINSPENRAFHPLQADSIQVKLEAKGWQLLFSSLLKEERVIQVDISGLSNRNWVIFSNQLGFINRQFPSDQRVISVSPDTLFFDFSKQTERRIPVRAIVNLQFAKRFDQIDQIVTQPAYVTIRGPLEDVSKYEYWETDTFKLEGVKNSIQERVSLSAQGQSNIKVFPTSVDVHVPVGEVTEKVIEVPITILNGKNYRSVRLIPAKVSLTVLVSLRDFASLQARAFEVVVDMNDWDEKGVSTLPIQVRKMPAFCKLVRVFPQNIDFFVVK